MQWKNLLLFILFLVLGVSVQAKEGGRKVLFDADWYFHRGTVSGAENPAFNHSRWRKVDLPHDWSVEPLPNQCPDKVVGPFSRESVGGFATGNTVGGEGWYRKTFVLSPDEARKRHELYFEGVYNQSEVWVNGHKAYYNVYGYTSFRFDITPYCRPAGQTNVVAVKVVNEGKNSRWYSGSGIYRHVWMLQTEPSHVDDWGTFVHTDSLGKDDAHVSVSAQAVLDASQGRSGYTLQVHLVSPGGKVVARQSQRLDEGDTVQARFRFLIPKPVLWSVDTPRLHTALISLWKDGKKLDEYAQPFGIRTIRFSVERGFELNGKSLKLKGGCVHHDNGLLGSAAFDRAEYRKIELLKRNGFNAVRTSHNPMSESFMDACDRLGMLVVDEAFDQWKVGKNAQDYHLYFAQWSARDIRSLVLRDRNRPSVIMWSIGNEIRERISDSGLAIAGSLRNEVRKYDTTRPVTAGINKYWNKERTQMLSLEKAYRHLDVVGHNYMWRFYEQIHEEYPQQVMYGSESVATEAAGNWDKVEKLPYLLGDFVWTAQDYLGESGIGNAQEISPQENVHQFMGWPWFNGWCGDLDLLGQKKPQSYYRDVLWRLRGISMAVEAPVAEGKIRKVSFWGWPEEQLSWTFPGMEGKDMKVNVYSRAPRVRLYLNGRLLEEKKLGNNYKVSFAVPYAPGQLKAVALDGNGKEQEVVTLATTERATALRLTPDKTVLTADGQDLAFVLIEQVDEQGHVVLSSGQKIRISSEGGVGHIIASGNASPTDIYSFGSATPTLFNGRAMVVVRAGRTKGKLHIKVEADGLKTAEVSVRSK